MHIALIRHLPTEWNRKTWLQGRRDIGISPVTDEDRKKIEENQHILRKWEPFDFILASSLKRTRQTAEIYGYTPQSENLLDELDFGQFEGKTKEQLMQAYPEQWVENPQDIVLGERVQNLETRIERFLKKYKNCENLLIFGHGSWMRAMISYYQFGHIHSMNKMIAENNDCVILPINQTFFEKRKGGLFL